MSRGMQKAESAEGMHHGSCIHPAVPCRAHASVDRCWLQADSWLQSKGIDPYYSLFPDRCNVIIAGAS